MYKKWIHLENFLSSYTTFNGFSKKLKFGTPNKTHFELCLLSNTLLEWDARSHGNNKGTLDSHVPSLYHQYLYWLPYEGVLNQAHTYLGLFETPKHVVLAWGNHRHGETKTQLNSFICHLRLYQRHGDNKNTLLTLNATTFQITPPHVRKNL